MCCVYTLNKRTKFSIPAKITAKRLETCPPVLVPLRLALSLSHDPLAVLPRARAEDRAMVYHVQHLPEHVRQ